MFTLDNTEGFTQEQIDLMNRAVRLLIEDGIEESSAGDIVNNNWSPDTENTVATLTRTAGGLRDGCADLTKI